MLEWTGSDISSLLTIRTLKFELQIRGLGFFFFFFFHLSTEFAGSCSSRFALW